MKAEPHTRTLRRERPRSDPKILEVAQVVPDTFTDLWVKYGDGSWRWVSLIGLAETRAYRGLTNRDVFKQGQLSQNRRWIEWPRGIRLRVEQLIGTVGELTPQQVMVRGEGDTAFGWYRPFWVWNPKAVRRVRLIELAPARKLSDIQILEWLGWTEEELQPMFRAYPTDADAVAARLLDLALYLGVSSRMDALKLRQLLGRTWAFSEWASPFEAVESGG